MKVNEVDKYPKDFEISIPEKRSIFYFYAGHIYTFPILHAFCNSVYTKSNLLWKILILYSKSLKKIKDVKTIDDDFFYEKSQATKHNKKKYKFEDSELKKKIIRRKIMKHNKRRNRIRHKRRNLD